ncbi:hypothetical protein FRC00_006213, partial [Tulasnella sp. 408]
MSQNAPMFDCHGKFAAEEFRQQARKILNSRNVIEKGQELDLLEACFKYLRQLKDPHDPAMLEFWHSGLFEEVIEILSIPISRDLQRVLWTITSKVPSLEASKGPVHFTCDLIPGTSQESNRDSGITMLRTVSMFDDHGNFATEELQQHANKIRNAQSVIIKGQELDRLQNYFKYLAQTKDPNDPAMVALWPSGLFEELIDILSTPLSSDMRGHLTLYHIALLTLNDTLPILKEQNVVYEMSLGEEFTFKFRDSLLGIFGAILMEFADDGLQRTLNADILLGYAFDYYFGLTPPAQGEYSANGARVILFDHSEEAFRRDPAPYLTRILSRRGEKNVADRYIELATSAGDGKLLDSESSWNLLTHLITVRSLQTRLLKEAKVHVTALETVWAEMSSLPVD